MTPAPAVKPFGELFKSALHFVRDHWKVILLASVPLAVITGLMKAASSLIPVVVTPSGPVVQMSALWGPLGLVLFVLFLCSVVAGAIVNAAYWVLVTEGGTDAKVLLKKALPVTLPIVGVQIWAALRSFAWLVPAGIVLMPFIGPLGMLVSVAGFALILVLVPRFFAAPYIYLKEKKGIMQSVEESHARTEGLWGKIMGNLVLFLLCMIVVSIIVMIPSGIVIGIVGSVVGSVSGQAGAGVGAFLTAEVQALLSVVGIAFTAMLSAAVLKPSKA